MNRDRRYAPIAEFRNFVKPGQMSKWLHHSGGAVCEPIDVAVNKRHLNMPQAHMTLSDKPVWGRSPISPRAADSVGMSRILCGADFVDRHAVMTLRININSLLTFDSVRMGVLKVYARRGRPASSRPSSSVAGPWPRPWHRHWRAPPVRN